jgi:hypothetical protein
MRRLALPMVGVVLAIGVAAPGWAYDDERRQDRRERQNGWLSTRHADSHDRLEDRHDDAHDRLEERHERAHERQLTRRDHRRLHEKLEDKHDGTHERLERRHDQQHGRYDPRYDDNWRRRGPVYGDRGYDYGWGFEPRPYGYGRSALRGDGWYRLGWIAREPRLVWWVMRNFDHNRNGSLGEREALYAERAIFSIADRDRDGHLTQRELDYWRIYAAR